MNIEIIDDQNIKLKNLKKIYFVFKLTFNIYDVNEYYGTWCFNILIIFTNFVIIILIFLFFAQ